MKILSTVQYNKLKSKKSWDFTIYKKILAYLDFDGSKIFLNFWESGDKMLENYCKKWYSKETTGRTSCNYLGILQQVSNMIGYKKERFREGESLRRKDGERFSYLGLYKCIGFSQLDFRNPKIFSFLRLLGDCW